MASQSEKNNHNNSDTDVAVATTTASEMIASIEAERAKSAFTFREEIAPGNCCELVLKRILVSTQSKYQKIDVIDTFFGKTLVTDGKTQSTQFDEFAYHESLVHPSMLHVAASMLSSKDDNDGGESSNRGLSVLVGGGGELATAREVLRHSSVKRLVMVDLDEKLVKLCHEYLPEWGGEKVTNDSRLELVFGDAHKYLLECSETFDVIIMDISDPIEGGPGAMLYTKEFYEHVQTLLSRPNGIIVTQAGMAEAVPATSTNAVGVESSCFPPIYNTLRAVFDCVIPYSSNIPSFASDWGFIMAFRKNTSDTESSKDNEESWKYPPSGLVDDLIEKEIHGGKSALQWYDGITHMNMFSLSKPLRTSIEHDDRIITKDNLYFMY